MLSRRSLMGVGLGTLALAVAAVPALAGEKFTPAALEAAHPRRLTLRSSHEDESLRIGT